MTGGGQRSEYTSSLTSVAAVVAVAALSCGVLMASIADDVAAFRGDDPDKTIPSPPTTNPGATTTDVATTEATAPTTEEPATSDVPATSEPTDTGIALPVNAELAPMFAVARPLIGPTTDVAGALATFADVPDGIPSPVDSTIQDFSIQYHGRDGFYTASATFTSTASSDDVVVFYETGMTAGGFVLETDNVQVADETRALEFSTPDSDYDGASVEVLIETDDDPVVTLTITDHVELATLAAFGGWARGMPTVGDGVPIEATLSAVNNPDFMLTVSTEFLYEDRTADELVTEIRDALADGSGGFHLDAENDDGGSTITMTHSVILDPGAEVREDDDGAIMTLTGSLRI